ncbi:flavodoxin family protein [Thalassotalea piscium]|uniref:Multimeric flavodoxin WrbA n=1 Tax=Thalassotalea piscium TaxID=1230533 RepID=A0A7X0TUD1_9GAMM|nr:NAD(P)H-dependent oxidoreductase [Thalassotalea piscium]MBB6543960.1 multimeric flavodoxin WrbA [Thalassotalea piscium]
MKSLLIVAHAPSKNTRLMAEAVLKGAQHSDIDLVQTRWIPPLDVTPEDVIACDAIIMGTTENLGYMSGALKDFFDRCYYPCLAVKQGLPCALYIRAGNDGTGTCKAVESICKGLRWKFVAPPLVCRGEWQASFLEQCEALGMTMAAGLDVGIY